MDDAEVVGDEQVADPELPLQVGEQVQHLGLDRDVERGDRLVADDHPRLRGERPGDRDPLALAARQLQRAPRQVLLLEADHLQQLGDPPLARRLVAVALAEGVEHHLLDRPARVEGAERVLVDHRDVGAALAALALRQSRPLLAGQGDAAAVDLEQGEREARGRRLAGARLADDPQRLPLGQLEGDVVDDRAVDAVGAAEGLEQALGLEDGGVGLLIGAGGAERGPALVRGEPRAARVGARDRLDQRLRVLVLGAGEELRRGRVLEQHAAVHHRHRVGELGDDGEVVADQDQRFAPRLRLLQLLQHLRLDGHVERRGRLVGDDQFRVHRDRRGDQGPLAEAAGELVGPLLGAHLGLRDADQVQQLDRPLLALAPRAPVVEPQRLVDLLADRPQLVERDERVLEDEADVLAAQAAPVAVAERRAGRGRRTRSGRRARGTCRRSARPGCGR